MRGLNNANRGTYTEKTRTNNQTLATDDRSPRQTSESPQGLPGQIERGHAMTRTKEQRPTTSFDLERARDVEKAMSPLPWFVIEDAHGEMIIIRNPDHPIHIDNLAARGKRDEANTPDAIGITYMRENFSNLIAEIERLRPFEIAARDLDSDLGKIAGERDELAARIKELEADNQNLVTMNKALMKNDWILRDNNRKYRKRAQKAELLNKSLKSKIGPDARPPCWRITEDRVTAIDQGLRFLEWSNAKTGHVETKKHIATLQTMLEETGDEHGFER